jgi:hypothetical protein
VECEVSIFATFPSSWIESLETEHGFAPISNAETAASTVNNKADRATPIPVRAYVIKIKEII